MENNAGEIEFVQRVENLFFLPRELQPGPVVIDGADFVIDEAAGESRCADIVLIEVYFVAAGPLGMDNPERSALGESGGEIGSFAIELVAIADKPERHPRP